MIDSRKLYEINQGDGSILNKLVITAPSSPGNGTKSWWHVISLLKMLLDQPQVLNPNGLEFETLLVKYKEGHWTVETTAIKKTKELNL